MSALKSIHLGAGEYIVTCKEPIKGYTSTFTVTADQAVRILAWHTGRDPRMLQEILPDLTDDERELLLSGISGKHWDELFGEQE